MNPERVYTVLLEPHISEKVSILGDRVNQYAFKVSRDATKAEIREAVQTLFKVDVNKVTTANVKGKVKKHARGVTRKKNWKKAYVTVAQGQEIDYMVVE
ncbi:MAG: 50S ribosomal protein L23 [Pseudomonadales bacterium]